ncbi:MAG: hypothetical protein IJ068_07665 [Bacilli bacterium]|nr:hypothetical protein [Bacilli bacterium]
MNISYLLNILDLYLLKEKNDPLIVEVHKKNNLIKVEFSYLSTYVNKTFVKLDEEVFFSDIKNILSKIQGNLFINNEELNDDTYKITLENNRQIRFIGFDVPTLESIRHNFSNLNTGFVFKQIEEENNITYDEIYQENKELRPSFSFGFSSFITIFLTSIWFLDIFMIALWIFKATR